MKFLFPFLLCIIISCSDKEQLNDGSEPVIVLTQPFDGQTFAAGAQVDITGTITDNDRITEVHIHVSNASTNQLLMDVHLSPNAASTNYNQSFTAVSGTSYKIQLIARDRSGNEGRLTVQVSSN